MVKRWSARFAGIPPTSIDLIVAGLAGGVFGLASLILSPQWVLIGLVAGIGALIAIRRPEIALLGILFITSTVLDKEFTSLPSVTSLRIVDFAYVALLGLIIWRWLTERDFRLVVTPLDAPLLAFLGVSMLSTVLGLLRSTIVGWAAFEGMRIIGYYLVFFVVTNLMRTRQQMTFLLRGLFLLAVFVSVAMLVQYVVGSSLVILAGRVETLGSHGDITRVLPPGESVLLITFLALTAILALDRLATVFSLRMVAWVLTGTAVVLTFNRNFWFSVFLGLVLLGIILTGKDRRRYFQWVLAVVTAFSISIAVLVVVAPETRVGRLTTASMHRFATLVNITSYGQDSSLRDRLPEYEYTIPQIISHPILGIGMGAVYRPNDSRLDWPGSNLRRYTHNAHIWLMMDTGLIGYLCMVWLSTAFLIRAFRHWRQMSNLELRGAVLGFAIAYTGILAASIVNPILMQYYWTPVIGLMMGISELAIRDSTGDSASRIAESDVA